MARFIAASVLVLTAWALTGCGEKNVKAYSGPGRPHHQTALVSCSPHVHVKSVDGNTRYNVNAARDGNCEIRVLPGRHTIDVCYEETKTTNYGNYVNLSTLRCVRTRQVELDARAGGRYKIAVGRRGTLWGAWVDDLSSAAEHKRATNMPAPEYQPTNKPAPVYY